MPRVSRAEKAAEDIPFPVQTHECGCSKALLELQQENQQLRRELEGAHKLQQENQQLRRELEDAHDRIHELVSTAADDEEDDNSVFITDADDCSSIEVQSVAELSATSSTSTLPTGSALANETRAQQQRREDLETKIMRTGRSKKLRQSRNKRNSRANMFRKYREPSVELVSLPSHMATLFESDSDSSSFDRASEVMGVPIVLVEGPGDRVSTFASEYFMRRTESDQSEFSTH